MEFFCCPGDVEFAKVSSIESVLAFIENVYEAPFARFGGNSITHLKRQEIQESLRNEINHHIIVLSG